MLSLKEIEKKYESLMGNEKIIGAFNSKANVDAVKDIATRNYLDEEKTKKLLALVGSTILGLIHPEDLDDDIVKELGLNPKLAKDIYQKIKIKVLSPLANELNEAHGFHLTPPDPMQAAKVEQKQTNKPVGQNDTPQTQPAPQEQPTQQKTPKPEPQKPTPQQGPAVIHEHESNKEDRAQSGYPGGLVRPAFYQTPNSASSGEETNTPQARLEIGSHQNTPQPTTKIGKEDARVVHYDTPDSPNNPFAGQEKTPKKESKEIPDSNIVNLKDLPK